MHMNETLLSRWNPKHDSDPTMAPAKFALEQILTVPDALRARSATIASDKKLSAIGRHDEIRKSFGEAEIGGRLYRARRAVETMRAKVNDRRAKLETSTTDKTDAAGAAIRVELRTMLRGMNAGARAQILFSENADPRFWEAALEAPDVASGINPTERKQILDAKIERFHPGEAAKIDEINEAVALVDAAYRISVYDTLSITGLPTDGRTNDLDSMIEGALGGRAENIKSEVASTFADFATT